MGILELIIVILLAAWILGMGVGYTAGGLIHLLLVVLVIVVIVRVVQGRRIE